MKIKSYEDRVDAVDKPKPPTDTTSHILAEQQRLDIERQDAMINDLIQLTRLQNTELNNLRQEVRHISTSATAKEDGLRAELDDLKQQVTALRAEQQQQEEKIGVETPTKLTRKAHVAIRGDQQTVKDRIIAAVKEDVTAQTLELEHKQGTTMLGVKSQVHDLEMIMSSVLSGIGCLYKTIVPPSETRDEVSSIKHYYNHLEQKKADLLDDLYADSELLPISKQQILLQHQFSALSTALEQRLSEGQALDVGKEEKPALMQKQIRKLSKTVDSQLQVISNHDSSIASHSEEIEKIQSCLSSLQSVLEFLEQAYNDNNGLKNRVLELEQKVASNSRVPFDNTTWNSGGGMDLPNLLHNHSVKIIGELSTKVESQEFALQGLATRLCAVEKIGIKHKDSLLSNGKDLYTLQNRLSDAEGHINKLTPN